MKRNIQKRDSIKISKYIIAIIAIITMIILIYIIKNNRERNKLIQLSAQGTRQMMGYVLKTQKDELIVIDGGTLEDTENLIEQINKNGGKVSAWFLTHAHDDHIGAFTKIINETDIQIDKIYKSFNDYSWYEENEPARIEFTKYLLDTLQNEKIKNHVEEVELNQIIKIDNITIEILGIKNPEIVENPGNEQSLVLKFNTGKTTLLILGDTGIKSSKKLLEIQKDKLKSDIVQMAHHGQNGATEELYKEISPTICLWPTPEWLWNNDSGTGYNSGPWKTLETKKWMENLGVVKNYVAKDGDLIIYIK